MLGSEKDALLESIRDEIERFAQGYAGAEMQRRIDDLDLALTNANLGNYESVARFLEIANS